jgi:flagellar protein FlaJ
MNKKFGYLSEIATRLIYFSKSWNLGFSTASRSIKRLIPYEPLVDFFDRLATISDFGEDVEVFFLEEQESMMDELVAEYNKTYENIKMIQELFTSVIVTMAFILAVLLLLPILTGASMDELIRTVTYIVFLIDAALIVVVRTLVPKDDIVHNLPIYDEYITRSNLAFLIVTPFCAILIAIIGFLFIPQLPFLVVIALGITPLFIPAILSIEAENKIMKRDNSFPAFIRTLGGAVEARGGGMVSTLDALRIHHFGEINEIFLRLFKRLRLGNDKFESWLYFGAESGSNLIYNFSQIFAETVYLGAKADTISDIISKNFQKILSLRKLKFQLTSALRGTFYGALVGFASAGYIGLEISTRLASTFSGPMSSISDPSISGDLQSIFPEVPEINLFLISSYVGIMIIFHAIATSYVLKIVNGSYRYSFFFDLIMMIWIGALMSWTVPFIMARVLPSMGAGATQVLTPF